MEGQHVPMLRELLLVVDFPLPLQKVFRYEFTMEDVLQLSRTPGTKLANVIYNALPMADFPRRWTSSEKLFLLQYRPLVPRLSENINPSLPVHAETIAGEIIYLWL